MNRNEELHLLKLSIFSIYSEMSIEAWHYIASNCQVESVEAKRLIIEADKTQKNIYFLTQGLVRGFYINDKGEEITIRFINHQGWITHYSALISNTPSKYTFQALEASHIISLPFSAIQKGYKTDKDLERFGRLIAENILITQQKRIESFQFQNAEQRYIDFVENNPKLFNRISLSHLSTYLGIQRQSLTRIRKKLASR